MNQLIQVPSGFVHVEWRSEGIGFVRTWQGHEHPLCPDTGQPEAPWGWACGIVRDGTVFDVVLMHEMPVWPSYAELRDAMASIGATHFLWHHWHGSRRRHSLRALSPAALPVVTYHPPTCQPSGPQTDQTPCSNSTAPEIRISAPNLSRPTNQQTNNIMEDKVTLVIGPIVTVSKNGVESISFGGVISNLDGKEAAETVADLHKAVLPFDHVSGEKLPA